jgi:L-rhamnose mutarotase
MTRYGSVVGLKPEKADEYKRLHAAVWPDVLKKIKESHIHNYSIYLRRMDDGRLNLFSYFEYDGDDFAADMAAMAADPIIQRWWACCKPCHIPFDGRRKDEWWAGMEEVFHCD